MPAMSSLKIQLSDDQMRTLKQRATALGFEDVESYARSLVANVLNQSFDAPSHLKIRYRKDLDAKLLECERSGRATEMTDADWADLKTEVRQRISARRASKAS